MFMKFVSPPMSAAGTAHHTLHEHQLRPPTLGALDLPVPPLFLDLRFRWPASRRPPP